MTITIQRAMAVAACDALNDFVDVGVGASTLLVYSGSPPVSIQAPLGAQTELVSIDLPAPFFQPAAQMTGGARAQANPVPEVTVAATGVASFFRIFDGNGSPVMQGSVTDQVGDGDMKLLTTSLNAGDAFIVVSIFSTLRDQT